MTSTGLRRKAVLLLLAFVLAFPWAASAGLRPASARAVAPSTSAFLEDLLSRVWSFLAGVRNKEGCHLDPSGGCAPGAIRPDTGCHLDPDGRCAPEPTIQTDTGCHLDPHGGCRS